MKLDRKKNILLFLFLLVFTIPLLGCHEQQTNKRAGGLEIQPTGEKKNQAAKQVLVKFHDKTSEQAISDIQERLGLKTIKIISQSKNLYLMEILAGDSVEEMAKQLRECPEVLQAEPNYMVNIN
jgi:uncharacterized lipoprotein YajG